MAEFLTGEGSVSVPNSNFSKNFYKVSIYGIIVGMLGKTTLIQYLDFMNFTLVLTQLVLHNHCFQWKFPH